MKSSCRLPVAGCQFRISNLGFRVSSFLYSFLLLTLAPCPGVAQESQAAPSSSLLSTADDVFQEMSRITGLPIRAPLKKQIIARPEIKKILEQNLHEEYTPQEIHIQESVLRAFGLVSRDFDFAKFLVTFYTEQAAGAYDPRRKTMFIADWPTEEMQRIVLTHELTHALQDQSFDLDKFLHARRENDDATNARQAVVEGYATAAMMQQMIGQVDLANMPALGTLMAGMVNKQMGEFPAYTSAPFFFRMQALFPYAQGMGYMQRGLQLGGWKELNAIFSNPPTTTREIFEPSVYFDQQAPLPTISLPRPPALEGVAGLKLLTENTAGELRYYSLLGQLISEDEAKTVATGWLADRFILYEGSSPDQFMLVARTRWSSAETALAFFRDYHTILSKKYPELAPDKRSATDLFVGTASNGNVILVRKGDECLWAEGMPAAQTDVMLAWLKSL